MSFFKNLGKTITDFGQDVANQSKNMSENAKLKAAISMEEKKLADLYRVMGKTYVDRAMTAMEHPDSMLAMQSSLSLFQNDQTAIDQIKAMRQKIQTLNMALKADGSTETPEE